MNQNTDNPGINGNNAQSAMNPERKSFVQRKKERKRRIALIVLGCLVLCGLGHFFYTDFCVPYAAYRDAGELLEAGKYDRAIEAYTELDGFLWSGKNIKECKYRKALQYLEQGDHRAGLDQLRELGDYSDSRRIVEEKTVEYYDEGQKMRAQGDYDAAFELFASIRGYKDTAELIENDHDIAMAANRDAWSYGRIVTYGRYEQDGDLSNGPEPIVWIVVKADGSKRVLLSLYGLNSIAYNEEEGSITWEDASLRGWLNGTFYEAAFDENEKKSIVTYDAVADKNYKFAVNAGNDTRDNVFLPSIPEINQYFYRDTLRVCYPTQYALNNGASYDLDTGACWWWLRTSGRGSIYASYVNNEGNVRAYGYPAIQVDNVVRPAIVLDNMAP